MYKLKIIIKNVLQKNIYLYEFALFFWKIVNFPKNFFKKQINKGIKKKAFKEFETNNGLITINYNGVKAKYETSSPFDYYKIKIGSQYENAFFKKIFNKITEGMIVYDVGGSIGMYTIPFAKKVGKSGKVFVFEPTKKGFESIKKNVNLNEINNVVTYPYALSDRTSEINFYVRPDKETHSLFEKTIAPSKTGKQEITKVKAFTIDDLIKRNLAEKPNFIKIDTEGAEIKVLNGMNEIYKNLNMILVEIHKPALKLENILNPEIIIEKKLKKIGFTKFEYLSNSHLFASKKIN